MPPTPRTPWTPRRKSGWGTGRGQSRVRVLLLGRVLLPGALPRVLSPTPVPLPGVLWFTPVPPGRVAPVPLFPSVLRSFPRLRRRVRSASVSLPSVRSAAPVPVVPCQPSPILPRGVRSVPVRPWKVTTTRVVLPFPVSVVLVGSINTLNIPHHTPTPRTVGDLAPAPRSRPLPKGIDHVHRTHDPNWTSLS